jgi:hypothetical protein
MKRFSRYEFALKSLRPKSTDVDANPIVPDAPTNTALREYQLFASGKKTMNITRSGASLQGSIVQAVIQPFGLPDTVANKINVALSARARDGVGTLSLSLTDNLNHLVGGSGRDLPGFIPAKVLVKNTGTAATTPISQITGQEYKTKKGPTYTLPFGAGAGTNEKFELEARETIFAVISTALPRAGVTFKSENLRKR